MPDEPMVFSCAANRRTPPVLISLVPLGIIKTPDLDHPYSSKMSTKAASKIPSSLRVTSGPSTDTEIHIDTPLGKYFARFHSNPFDAKIKNSELFIGDLQISFRRTVRVPAQTVDDQPSRLPPDLGPFPLYNVAEFSNLPHQMIQKGGCLMPMYRTFFHNTVGALPNTIL